MSDRRGPLGHLKVIELGTVIAGPFAGSLLAEHGADVIKIENPDNPDPLRTMGAKVNGVPLWWGVSGRAKRVITLNLKSDEGRRRFEELVRDADILVENYRPGVLDRLGLGWERLSQINPRLIQLSITGFGQTGPYAPRPGFGKIAEGMCGMVPLTGAPGETPVHVGFSLADTAAGLFGFFGLAVALWMRETGDGRGARIDAALFEPLVRMLDCQFALHERLGGGPERQGSNDPYGWGARGSGADAPVHQVLQGSDGGWIRAVHRSQDALADAALRLCGTAAQDAAAASAALVAWARERPHREAAAQLVAAGVAAAPVFDGLSIAREPYFRKRGDVVPVTIERIGEVWAPGSLCPEAPLRSAFKVNGLGEHNEPTSEMAG